MLGIVNFPSGRVVHRVESPGFGVVAPAIVHRELVAPSLLEALTPTWTTGRGPHLIEFHSLRDVYVVGEGLVFDKNLSLLAPSITQTEAGTIERAHLALREALAADHVGSLAGPLLLCGKAGLNNYGHWLVEMLPMAELGAHWLALENGWRVLVPQVYPWMRGVIEESLDLVGVPAGRRVFNTGQPCRVSELVFVEGMTRHGQFLSPLVLRAMDRIAGQIEAGEAGNVWVTREDSLRQLRGEAAANERIAALGWRVVSPGRMTFREQVAMARGARHMAGVNGAGLTNLVFMGAGGTVTTFVPAKMPDIFFWQLCLHRGLGYQEIRSDLVEGQEGATSWDGPLTIPIEEVLGHLERVSRD